MWGFGEVPWDISSPPHYSIYSARVNLPRGEMWKLCHNPNFICQRYLVLFPHLPWQKWSRRYLTGLLTKSLSYKTVERTSTKIHFQRFLKQLYWFFIYICFLFFSAPNLEASSHWRPNPGGKGCGPWLPSSRLPNTKGRLEQGHAHAGSPLCRFQTRPGIPTHRQNHVSRFVQVSSANYQKKPPNFVSKQG